METFNLRMCSCWTTQEVFRSLCAWRAFVLYVYNFDRSLQWVRRLVIYGCECADVAGRNGFVKTFFKQAVLITWNDKETCVCGQIFSHWLALGSKEKPHMEFKWLSQGEKKNNYAIDEITRLKFMVVSFPKLWLSEALGLSLRSIDQHNWQSENTAHDLWGNIAVRQVDEVQEIDGESGIFESPFYCS